MHYTILIEIYISHPFNTAESLREISIINSAAEKVLEHFYAPVQFSQCFILKSVFSQHHLQCYHVLNLYVLQYC